MKRKEENTEQRVKTRVQSRLEEWSALERGKSRGVKRSERTGVDERLIKLTDILVD